MKTSICPKCNGEGFDIPYDPKAPKGSLENPMTREEAEAAGVDTDNAQQEAEEDEELNKALACKACGGIGWVYDEGGATGEETPKQP